MSAQLPPDSATILERSRDTFITRWEELLRMRRAVMKSSDLNDIHDLRVASRRFRAALELYYPFAPKGAKTELKKNVRKLTRILGGLRNIDEAQLFFRSRLQTDGSIDKKLNHSLSELRSKEFKRIKKALMAFDQHALDRIVRELIAGVNEDSITKRNRISILAYFSEVSIRLYLPIQQLLAASPTPEQRTLRHALRIAIKKWRYFLEIMAEVLDRDYATLLELLKEYQSILGRMNDITVFRQLVGDLNLSSHQQDRLDATLAEEEICLLGCFTELVEQKPLTYKFLI